MRAKSKLWKSVKIASTSLLITLCLFLFALEIFVAQKKQQYLNNPAAKGNVFLQRIFLYGDPDHLMHADRHKDLNSDNIRSTHEPQDINIQDTNIIFLGDSFTYGFLLSARASIPSQFEVQARTAHPNLNINAINFGWVSSSPLLDYRLLKTIGKKYKPDVVVLSLDLGDFGDDILYTRMLEHRDIFLFARYLPGTTFLLEAIANTLSSDQYESLFGYPKSPMFANEWPLERSRPYIEAYSQKIIDDIARYTTQELHAKFVLVMNPRSFQYSNREALQDWNSYMNKRTENSFEIFRYMDELRIARDYPVISLLPSLQNTSVFPTTFGTDSHWNKEGCRLVASLLLENLETLKILD